jgi:hypothetical protein
MIDPRIKFPVVGPWSNPATGEIILNRAMTLECFSSALVNGQTTLTNETCLQVIENMLSGIRVTPIQGFNPTHF